MDLAYSKEEEAFRKEVRGWLKKNLPKKDKSVSDLLPHDPERVLRAKEWQRMLYDAGYVAMSWPKEYGGQAADIMRQTIVNEELVLARAPGMIGASGLGMLGPTLIQLGTEEQKRRYLRKILTAEEIWCQGYSEPGAGSDLAGLQTRAVDMGDDFIVNGQKVWTSGAQYADWIFMLVRTDPDAPKHNGISYILVDMKTPGITVRPLVLANGHAHFNEVFFEDVRVPKANLVGPQNQGWKVTITTLMFERAIAGGGNYSDQVTRLAELAKRVEVNGQLAWEQSWVRQKLAHFMIECESLRLTRLRTLSRQLRGLPPGPEGSMLKLCGSELGVRIALFASELLGDQCLLNEPTEAVPDAPRWYNRVLSARQYTIAGGTSEIQHNIIGERVLGMPKG